MSPTASDVLAEQAKKRAKRKKKKTPDYKIPSPQLEAINDLDINRMILNEKTVNANVINALIGNPDVERTIEGASTVVLPFHDPDHRILNSIAGYSVGMSIDDLVFKLVKVSKSEETLTLTFEDAAVAWMRKYKKPRKAYRDKVTRAQFARSLVKEVKELKIGFYCPELYKRQTIDPRGRSSRTRRQLDKAEQDRKRDPGFPNRVSGTVKGIRATKEQVRVISDVLETGVDMEAPRMVLVAAVETVIVESVAKNLPGGDLDSVGAFQQRTSWGSYKSRHNVKESAVRFYRKAIPIYRNNPNLHASQIAQAVQISGHPGEYGKRAMESIRWVDSFKGGTSVGAEGGTTRRLKRYAFTRGQGGKKEDTWTCLGRLADEVGWRRFMVGKKLYFISEKDLMKSRPRYVLNEESPGVKYINFDYDTGKKVAEATVECFLERWEAPPGTVVKIEDMGPVNGRWLVVSTKRPFHSSEGSVTLKKPKPELPEPSPQAETVTGTRGFGTRAKGDDKVTTTGGAEGIVNDAVRIAKSVSDNVYLGSGYRRGDPKDHGSNDADKAARDIGVQGLNLLTGPPSPLLDRAVVLIGKAFGRNYGNGKRTIIDTFHWNGFRIQIIWRTPLYGGHMGHIHIGARKL